MIRNRRPLVSIITPCYNVEKFIGEYLESILSQTYENIEIILINDGSTDRTEEIIYQYKDRIIDRGYLFQYLYQENSGQASALNKGLKIFKGDYFTWPDSDDILSKDNVKIKVEFVLNNQGYRLVRGKRKFFENNLNVLYDKDSNKKFNNENIFYDLFMERTFPSGGCYLMERELFLECYPEREIYQGLGSQNWQLLVPAASKAECGNINEYVYFVRIHPNSFSRRKRTLEEWFERFDDHKNLLLDAFEHSDCDYIKCKKMIDIKYARRKLNYAFNYKRKKVITEQYKILSTNNALQLQDRFKYLLINNKLAYSLFNKIREIKNKAF